MSYIYRVEQEECARLREGVPYVRVYRYNPKHLYPKLNGLGDNGQWSLKLWQLLPTYWLPNSYWKWQEYVVSVMLISVLNIKLTCDWHKAIKLNYKNTHTHVIVVLKGSKHYTWRWNVAWWRNTCARPIEKALTTHSRESSADKDTQLTAIVLEPKEVHNFQLPLSPKPFNFGYRCFGLYRYTLT